MKLDFSNLTSNQYVGFRADQMESAPNLLTGKQMTTKDGYWDNTTVTTPDTITGSTVGGNLFMRAMAGDDKINISSGMNNWVTGNMGDDTFNLDDSGNGADGNIKGANGRDTINIWGGFWGFSSGPINGNQEDDTLNNYANCGQLRGGIGDDVITNFEGAYAKAYGDPGADTFVIHDNSLMEIMDYNFVEGDNIDTSNLLDGWTVGIADHDGNGGNNDLVITQANGGIAVIAYDSI